MQVKVIAILFCAYFMGAVLGGKRFAQGSDSSESNDQKFDHAFKAFVCGANVIYCAQPLLAYLSPSYASQASLRNQCRDIYNFGNCTLNGLDGICTLFVSEATLNQVKTAYSFVCEEKLDEFEKHEQCIKVVDPQLEQCSNSEKPCDATEFLSCATKLIESHKEVCQEGAVQLLTDTVNMLSKLDPDCTGVTMLQKLKVKFFR